MKVGSFGVKQYLKKEQRKKEKKEKTSAS